MFQSLSFPKGPKTTEHSNMQKTSPFAVFKRKHSECQNILNSTQKVDVGCFFVVLESFLVFLVMFFGAFSVAFGYVFAGKKKKRTKNTKIKMQMQKIKRPKQKNNQETQKEKL